MATRSVVRQFLIAFLGTTIVVFVVLRTELVEQVSYRVEKGRLQALSEAAPSEELLEQINHSNRVIARLVTPAVVQVAVTRKINFSDGGEVAARSGRADGSREIDAVHPWFRGDPAERDAGESRFFEVQELGSGFVFDAEKGYVLTNYHVTAGADSIEVYLADGRRFIAAIVGADPATDLAVLAIPAKRLHQIEFGDSGGLAVGDEVFAIGNPFGLEGTFSRGIVSALGRSNVSIRGVTYRGFIQTDAVINPGNSGGPLVNRRGQVVGVNTAIATNSGSYDGVGFAIPSARVVGLIPKLLEGGKIVRGFLGVVTANVRDERSTADELDWPHDYGVIVKYVEPDSPAGVAGLRGEDILVEIDGHRIRNVTDLMDLVALIEPGTVSTLGYWRDGDLLTVQVELARRPDGI